MLVDTTAAGITELVDRNRQCIALGGIVVAIIVAVRSVRRKQASLAWGAIGAVALSLLIGALLLLVGNQPQLANARFVWALVVTYLLMCALFESFVYPLIILLAVPVAAVGGFLGLAALNRLVYQPLDMLTMLGFVILIGIVVNNAILIVHQALHHIREDGMSPKEGIQTATRNRIRPIFMSTLTSVFGMLPLVLFPGAGSELYRGLGSVVVGGLSVSAIITLLIVPPMMSLLVVPLESLRQRRRANLAEATA